MTSHSAVRLLTVGWSTIDGNVAAMEAKRGVISSGIIIVSKGRLNSCWRSCLMVALLQVMNSTMRFEVDQHVVMKSSLDLWAMCLCLDYSKRIIGVERVENGQTSLD